MPAREGARPPRIRALAVSTTQGRAGNLVKDSTHVFAYDAQVLAAGHSDRAISLTMPLRAAPWQSVPLHPAFHTFLPEGFLRDRIRDRFGKALRVDDMALLALTGANAIGRLRVRPVASTGNTPSGTGTPDSDDAPLPPESLAEVLSDSGSRDLFAWLCDRYLIASGVAGVQPKVLLEAVDEEDPATSPSRLDAGTKASLGERATLRARRLIVKAAGPEYPGLAVDEYHCLSIAKAAGLTVPRFWLSQDGKRLAIERFDFDPDSGMYLGFEDMVSLQGRGNDQKYEGSYESVALAVRRNSSAGRVHGSLNDLFRAVAISVLLRNGDAHLKNFGLLYTHPDTDDCRLSPVYDLVCTTVFIPPDLLALTLAGSRAWPARHALCEFGRRHCEVDDPEGEIDRLAAAALDYRPGAGVPVPAREDAADGLWRAMRREVEAAAAALGA